MKYLIILTFGLLIFINSNGQIGYYMTDTLMVYGADINDGGAKHNSRVCEVKEFNQTKRFLPGEVTRYQLKSGRIYIAKQISVSDTTSFVFLEQVLDGKIGLLYYPGDNGSVYLLQKKDSALVELKRKNEVNAHPPFREQLKRLTADKSSFREQAEMVHYSRSSLKSFVTAYNEGELLRLGRPSYGVSSGVELSQLVLANLNDFSYWDRLKTSFSVALHLGIWGNFPIGGKGYSFFGELYIACHSFSESKTSGEVDMNLLLRYSSLKLPMMLRYTFNKEHIRPFINGGFIVAKNMVRQSDLLFATKNGNIINIVRYDDSKLVASTEFGFGTGVGAVTRLNGGSAISLGLQYGYLRGVDFNCSHSEIKFTTAISF